MDTREREAVANRIAQAATRPVPSPLPNFLEFLRGAGGLFQPTVRGPPRPEPPPALQLFDSDIHWWGIR